MSSISANERKKMKVKIYCNTTLKDLKRDFPNRFLDGFDDCIIGTGNSHMGTVVLYSEKKIIAKLMKKMSSEEACEAFEQKMLSTYSSECPPVFLIGETLDKTAIL